MKRKMQLHSFLAALSILGLVGAAHSQPAEAAAKGPKGAGAEKHAGHDHGAHEKGAHEKGAHEKGKPGAMKAEEGAAGAGKTKATPEQKQAIADSRSARKAALEHYREARKALMATHSEDEEKLTPEQKEARKEARKALQTAQKELRVAQKGTRKARAATLTPEQREKFKERLKELSAERKASREERKKKAMEAVKAEVGSEKPSPAIRNELRHHAWRVARLNQLIALAEAGEREEMKAKAEQLLEKENARFAKKLEKLKSEKPKGEEAGSETEKAAPAVPAAEGEAK